MATESKIRADAVDDDFGEEEGLQCSKHPYRNTASNAGICALCLQDKLGKLVSSASSSLFNVSSSSPSFRSDPSSTANAASLSLTLALRPATALLENHANCSSGNTTTTTTRRSLIPFLLSHRKKKSTPEQNPSPNPNLILKRSKSAVAPRRPNEEYLNPTVKRGGFWSFLYHSKPKRSEKASSSSSSSARDLKPTLAPAPPQAAISKRADYMVVVDESVDSPSSGSSNATSSFGRKVSRSRSVGCGSRSFSGDFFERISTGFGDCTLRRVESQRHSSSDVIKEKVRCAGIFSGFMMTSSEEPVVKVRGKSRKWALASPIRALAKQPSPTSSSSSTKVSKAASKANTTPNLSAIPSLLTATG